MSARFFTGLILIFWLGRQETVAQVGQSGLVWIENALENNQVSKADSALKAQLKLAAAEGMDDSLPPYVSYVGRIAGEKGGDAKGIEAVNRFVDEFLEKGLAPNLNKQAFREAAGYFEYIGATALAYEANIKAFELGQQRSENQLQGTGENPKQPSQLFTLFGKKGASQRTFI
jgi:hypothetical protein